MTRVATYAQHLLTQSYLRSTQSRVSSGNTAIASGKVAQTYAELGVDSHRLLSLEDSNAQAAQYAANIDRASGRLNIMESAVGTLVDRGIYVLGQLAIAVNADNADNIALDQLGGTYLIDTANTLNVRYEGRTLFSGSRGNLAPVDLAGYDPTAAWPPAAPGAVDLSYYQGDGVRATARADEALDLEYGITADEPGFEKLMRALAYTRWAGQNPTDPDRGTVLAEAMDLTREAIGDLGRIRSEIGAKSAVLEATQLRHEQFQNYATEAISGLEDTDLPVAITQLSADQALLQASYLSLARLDSISLIDFLR
jgi:flagellar hook-associated protein 3 FlgL